MKRRISLILSFTCAIISFASDFDEVLNTVVKNNLTQRYSTLSDEAKIEGLKGENQLEAPELGFDHVWGAGSVGNKLSLSLSQSFDWPGVYAARRKAIETSSTAMQYLREATLLDTRMEARLLLIDLIYTKQRINIVSDMADGMATLADNYKKAMEDGSETRLDYNKAVIEKISVDKELETLRVEYEGQVASLEVMNGGKDVAALLDKLGTDYPELPMSAFVPDINMLRERDPEYAAAMASVDAAASVVRVERLSRYPGFSLGYNYEYEMGDIFNGFSFSVTLPFLSRKHKVKAATFEMEAAKVDAEMKLTARSSEFNSLYRQAQVLRRFLDRYEEVVKDDSNLKLLRKALDGGQINFLTYLQEVNFFLSAHKDYLDTLYQYHQTLGRLSRYN